MPRRHCALLHFLLILFMNVTRIPLSNRRRSYVQLSTYERRPSHADYVESDGYAFDEKCGDRCACDEPSDDRHMLAGRCVGRLAGRLVNRPLVTC